MRQTIIRAALMTGLIVSTFSPEVFADRVTEAKLRFEQGADLIKSSEVRKGLNEMLISNRLAPNPNTLLNVARSLEYLKYYEYAYLVYDEYLREDSISQTDRDQAKRAFERVGRRVARLFVETDPPNAVIYVDRKTLGKYGETPRRIATQPGQHRIILSAPNYNETSLELDLSKGAEQRLSVALRPKTRDFILSTKDWAKEDEVPLITVTKDGRLMGTTNSPLTLPVGKQNLSLSADGFETLALEIELPQAPPVNSALTDDDWEDESDTDTLIHEIKLEPMKGSARILANEIGALIYLDDQEVGYTPQVIKPDVGRHRLRLELTGFKAWEGELTVPKPPNQLVGEIEFRRPRERLIHPAWAWGMTVLAVGSASLGFALALEGNRINRDLPPYPSELEVADGNRYLLLADGAGIVAALSAIASYLLFRSQSDATLDTPRSRFYDATTPLEDIPPFQEQEQKQTNDRPEDAVSGSVGN
ncbi:MAG: PEGA domain-containing protein [Bradymonadia bacterium]